MLTYKLCGKSKIHNVRSKVNHSRSKNMKRKGPPSLLSTEDDSAIGYSLQKWYSKCWKSTGIGNAGIGILPLSSLPQSLYTVSEHTSLWDLRNTQWEATTKMEKDGPFDCSAVGTLCVCWKRGNYPTALCQPLYTSTFSETGLIMMWTYILLMVFFF